MTHGYDVSNDNITLGVIPCATTNILYYLNGKALAKAYSQTQVAAKLGRNKFTISRELHRNYLESGSIQITLFSDRLEVLLRAA